MELTPGELWSARPDPTVGREQAGRRPLLVVGNDDYLGLVTMLALVVPVTPTERRWPNHILISGMHDLPQRSFAMTEQVRAVARERLTERVGVADAATLDAVRRWVIDFLVP